MQIRKRLWILFLAAVLSAAGGIGVSAHEVPDLTRKGSVTITMREKETAVAGGSMTLYRVGAVAEDDGNYSFEATGAFAACGASFAEVQSAQLAQELGEYAKKEEIAGETKEIGADGTVRFAELEPGLYLFVQETAAQGYREAEPFLVSLPFSENGTYVYEVDASPKVEAVREPESPGNSTPEQPKDPILPITGQRNWPIPVLAVLGVLLFSIGWIRRRRSES